MRKPEIAKYLAILLNEYYIVGEPPVTCMVEPVM
jgi:hypothetical protein